MSVLAHISIMVDSCAFGPCDTIERKAIEELQKLEIAGRINPLEIAEATEGEQEQIGTPPVIRKQSSGRVIAATPDCISYEQWQKRRDIRNILFGNKLQLTNSDEIDINNIYTAWHHKYSYFVTYDKKHILSKAGMIWKKFQVRCVTPQGCLKAVTELIQKRV